MTPTFPLIAPRFTPPLDPQFRPAALANRAFRQEVEASGAGVPLVIGLERSDGACRATRPWPSPTDTRAPRPTWPTPSGIVKFLLWARGGWKVYAGGPTGVGEHLARVYSPGGAARVRLPLHGRAGLPAPVHRRACAAGEVPPAARERAGPGPPPGRLPHRLRPGRVRPESVGRGGRTGRSSARRSSGSPAARPTRTTTTATSWPR